MVSRLTLLLLLLAPAAFAEQTSLSEEEASQIASLIISAVMLALMFAAYFLPWIIAKNRGHRSSLAIFWTLVFFGWTLIGWLLAFIWSCTGNTDRYDEP